MKFWRVVQRDPIQDHAVGLGRRVDQGGVADAAVDRAKGVGRLPPRVVVADEGLAALSVDHAVAHDGGTDSVHGDEIGARARIADADAPAIPGLLVLLRIARGIEGDPGVDPQCDVRDREVTGNEGIVRAVRHQFDCATFTLCQRRLNQVGVECVHSVWSGAGLGRLDLLADRLRWELRLRRELGVTSAANSHWRR